MLKKLYYKKKKNICRPCSSPISSCEPSSRQQTFTSEDDIPNAHDPHTLTQPFIFKDGVPNARSHVLGNSSAIRSTTSILGEVKNVVPEIQIGFQITDSYCRYRPQLEMSTGRGGAGARDTPIPTPWINICPSSSPHIHMGTHFLFLSRFTYTHIYSWIPVRMLKIKKKN